MPILGALVVLVDLRDHGFPAKALLLRLGQEQAALQMYNEVLAHSKRFASTIEDEQRWVAAAQQAIRGA